MGSPTDQVLQFIADFGAAWASCRGAVDNDPLRGLDQWDAAVRVLRADHFAPNAAWDASEEFSRIGAEHEAGRELVVGSREEGAVAHVITRTSSGAAYFASVAAQKFGALHFEYTLSGAGGAWRISSIESSVTPPSW